MGCRKVLGLMLSVLLVVGLWTAPAALAQDKPQKGGVLRVALAGDPPSLDMHQESTFLVDIPMSTVYNTLVMYDPHGYPKIIGDLAKSWTVSDDKMTWTFTLHQGVKFHDDSDLTSADVKASWDRIVFPPEGVVSPRKSYFLMIKSVEAPDPSHRGLPPALRLAVVSVDAGPSCQLHLCQEVSRSGPAVVQKEHHGQWAFQVETVRARRLPGG